MQSTLFSLLWVAVCISLSHALEALVDRSADVLVVDSFSSEYGALNELQGDSTDDGSAVQFRREKGNLYLQVGNLGAYFRTVLDAETLCYDMSSYNYLMFRIRAAPKTRVTLTVQDGYFCDGQRNSYSRYPWTKDQAYFDLHRFVQGGEFTGGDQTVVIPVSMMNAEVNVRGLAVLMFTHLHTAGNSLRDQTTTIELGTIKFTKKNPTTHRAGLPARSRVLRNCRPGTFAITFDDCASKHMPRLLQEFAKYNAKMTCFTLGRRIKADPTSVLEAARQGHQIAQHSYTHPSFAVHDFDKARISKELIDTEKELNAIGLSSKGVFRPPYGEISEANLIQFQELGYHTTVLWNIDSVDYTYATSDPAALRAQVFKYVDMLSIETGGGNLLLHDDLDASVELAIELLPYLTSKGYQLTTIEQCAM